MQLERGKEVIRFQEMLGKKYYEFADGYKLKTQLSRDGKARVRWLMGNQLSRDSLMR